MNALAETDSTVELRLQQYFDKLGTVLWDSRQRQSFATLAVGLMSELENKSLEPIAAAFAKDPSEAERLHQRLQNVCADAPWPDEAVRRIAVEYALGAMRSRAPVQAWICDDTPFIKSGNDSVGVQRQYCGQLGKVANCQVAPSLVLSTERAQVLVDMQLYLPESWACDPKRRKQAQIPEEVQFQTKPEIMRDLIDRALAAGLPPGVVLGDAAFGTSLQFRQELRARNLHYLLSVRLSTAVCVVKKGRIAEPQQIDALLKTLPEKAFRRIHFRRGRRGKLGARFAFLRVRIPKDPTEETLWLILEWRDGEDAPSRAHLSSLPPSTSKKRLVYLLRERYRTEQTYREAKQELGLDHYQGRKWRGFMHHVSVVLCCYAFLVAERENAFPPCGRWSSRRRLARLEPPHLGAHAGAERASRPRFDPDPPPAHRARRRSLAPTATAPYTHGSLL